MSQSFISYNCRYQCNIHLLLSADNLSVSTLFCIPNYKCFSKLQSYAMNVWLHFDSTSFFHRKSLTWQKTSWPHSPLKVLPVPTAQTQYPRSMAGKWATAVWLCGSRTDSEDHQPLLMKTLHTTACFLPLQIEFFILIILVVLWIQPFMLFCVWLYTYSYVALDKSTLLM